MKRIIALWVACLLLAALTISMISCNNSTPTVPGDDAPLTRNEATEPPATRNDNTGTPSSTDDPGIIVAVPDFSAVLSGNGDTDTVWGSQNEAARQAVIESARNEGYDVTFDADGTMTARGADGTVLVQHPDGTWTVTDSDGYSAQFGGNWPENEYTRVVPKPDLQLTAASAHDDSFAASFESATVSEVKAYAEKLKAAGFTLDPEEQDQELSGMVIYTYTASNEDGYTVEIFYASGMSGITIRK